MKQFLLITVLLGALLPGADAVAEATVLVVETEAFQPGALDGTASIYVDTKRVRIDSNEGGGNFTIIYAGGIERPVYWLIDHVKRTYVEIDREVMVKNRRALEQSIDTMRRQLDTVSPTQREEMERMMKDNMQRMGFSDSQVEYVPVSRGVKIGGRRCIHYQGERDGTKVEEVWAAPAAEMGLRPSDLAALGEMADMFESTGQDMPAFFNFDRKGKGGKSTYEGFPVIVVTYDDGKRREKSQVKEVRREELASDFFDLPQGLTQQYFDR